MLEELFRLRDRAREAQDAYDTFSRKTMDEFAFERRGRRITLREMARQMGISPSFISAVETGQKKASGDFVQAYRVAMMEIKS